jgi:hypothetical protein
MKTQSQIRIAFWDSFPEYQSFYRKGKKQNDYKTDIRVAFVDFVDHLQKQGIINEKLAERVTL